MACGKNISDSKRAQITALHEIGWGYKQIGQHSSVRLGASTVVKICQRYTVNNPFTSKYPGQKRVMSPDTFNFVQQAIKDNSQITYVELQATQAPGASMRTICRQLQELWKQKWKLKKRIALTQDLADKRLAWAILHQNWSIEQWKNVVWSDKCSIERGKGARPTWSFLTPAEQLEAYKIEPHQTGHSIRQMF
jgi:hypothetical protein